MKDDESDKLGKRLASVYWKGYLEHIARELSKKQILDFQSKRHNFVGKTHFEKFTQKFPEYDNLFLDKRFYVLIPKFLDNYPKIPDKKHHGIEKIVSFNRIFVYFLLFYHFFRILYFARFQSNLSEFIEGQAFLSMLAGSTMAMTLWASFMICQIV